MERLTKKIDSCTVFPEELIGVTLVPDNPIMCKMLLRLAAYEDTGLEPEEVLPKDKADEIALKLMRLADLESLCNYTRLRKLAEADKDGDEICRAALEAFGERAQMTMAVEEMSELAKELCKRCRGRDNVEAIAEEIADVEIMLQQMVILFDCKETVDKSRQYKLERLAGRIEEAKEHEHEHE